MQNAFILHVDLGNGLAYHKSPKSSVVHVTSQCTEGHGFDFQWGLKSFPLFLSHNMLVISAHLF